MSKIAKMFAIIGALAVGYVGISWAAPAAEGAFYAFKSSGSTI
jgi:hypothetical protein